MRIKNWTSGRWITILALVAFIVGLGLIVTQSSETTSLHWFNIVPLRSSLPPIHIAKPATDPILLHDLLADKWTLLCYVGTPVTIDPRYLTILENRFGPQGFQVVLVAPRGQGIVGFASGGAQLRNLWSDVDGALEKLLQIPPESREVASWTLLIDPQARIDFSFPSLLKNDDIRQLVEGRLVGQDLSESADRTVNYMGSRLPPISLRNLNSSVDTDLRELFSQTFTVAYFPANTCTSCTLNSMQTEIASFAEKISFSKEPYAVILSTLISDSAVVGAVDAAKGHIYQSTRELPEFENPYFSLAGIVDAPLVLRVSADFVVLEQDSLEDWLQSRRSSN